MTNKKVLIPLIITLVVIGLIFLIVEKTSKPEQPLKEAAPALREEIRLIHEEAWLGKISQEETAERLTVLENKVAELISQYGLKDEVDEFVAQRKSAEELAKWAEPRTMTLELQLAGIAKTDADLVNPLVEELSGIRNEIYEDQISQEEVEEKLAALEDEVAELLTQHNIEAEIDDFVARYKTAEELAKLAEPRIKSIDLQLGGVVEYFVQKYRIDTGTEVGQARALQGELRELSDEIWEEKVSREEIEEKLLVFESKTAELIAQHGIQAEVDEYVARVEVASERVTAIGQRIANIQLQLTALEFYLSEKEQR